jgi:L-lactate utilization protein LutC
MTTITHTTLSDQRQLDATVEQLRGNGFAVQVVDTGDEAKRAVLDLIPHGSEVFTSTSVTLDEIGLADELNGDHYVSLRNRLYSLMGDPARKKEMKQTVAAADFVVASVHAVTADGQLMIASASGSQLPLAAYGADHVVLVVGSHKLVSDLDAGLDRIRTHIVPLEDARAMAAYGIHTMFAKLLVINQEVPGRVTVILVNEQLGY